MCIRLPLPYLNHTQRVRRLYKRGLRNLEAFKDQRYVYRYAAVLFRQQFDANMDVDMCQAKNLLEKGEAELKARGHWDVRKFMQSPGGCDHGREVVPPDWVLDYWHPIEKMQYPDYFARREHRKSEFIEAWKDKYLGKKEI